ncbi:MAG TPA: hypothetical protein VGD53_32715 [Actinoallomurus sp.]
MRFLRCGPTVATSVARSSSTRDGVRSRRTAGTCPHRTTGTGPQATERPVGPDTAVSPDARDSMDRGTGRH